MAPRAVVAGALEAAAGLGVRPVLVGDAGRIEAELRRAGGGRASVDIVDAPEVIEMHEHPAMALRRKRRSSIAVAMQQVRDGNAEAVVSAGHTGAAMGAALFVLGRIREIDRPAIAAVLPSVKGGPVVLLDAGANVDCRPDNLLQFGVMGAVYAEEVLGVASPRVGLLSNGEEDTKGNDLTIHAAGLLRESGLRFTGNVEARDLLFGVADVVICEGFVGNIALKTGEGLVGAIREIFGLEFGGMRGALLKLYLLPLAPYIRRIWGRLDYREYGGAPLLGTNGICIVAHGRSNSRAIRNAIRVAAEAARHRLPDRIRGSLQRGLALAGGVVHATP